MRKLLDKIICENGGNNWWKPELFQQNTLSRLPKKLKMLEIPPDKDKNYNCFLFALGFADDATLIRDCNGFIYDTFFQKLIDIGLLEYANDPKKDDYILYRNSKYPGAITHIGIMDGDRVVSKWAWGPLFRHKIFDVPESYGNDVSYIKAIQKEKTKELYYKYKEFNIKPENYAKNN